MVQPCTAPPCLRQTHSHVLHQQQPADRLHTDPALRRLQKVPEDWQCPVCGAERSTFVTMQREVAGFAENQASQRQMPLSNWLRL